MFSIRPASTLCQLAALAALMAISSCSNRQGHTLAPVVDNSPRGDSPTHTVLELQWALNNRDTLVYQRVFSADYRFQATVGALADSLTLDRAHELQSARRMLVTGSPWEPPAVAVVLTLAPEMSELPDPRSGKNPLVHREVDVQALLRVHQPDIQVTGSCHFFMVRGDSAAWPPGQRHDGPDSTRWFVERWWDDAPASAIRTRPAHTLPGRQAFWWDVKNLWLIPPPGFIAGTP